VAFRDPLTLWSQSHWELRGVTDAELFFRSLATVGLAATTLFLEGTSQPPRVRAVLERLREAGPYLPERHTAWPASERWRLPFAVAVLEELGRLAASHAPAELLDHLFAFGNETPLLEWPDAFAPDAPLHMSSGVSETSAAELGHRAKGVLTWVAAVQR
jgi:hypothetical protein